MASKKLGPGGARPGAGRPPALSPADVAEIRRLRSLPTAVRPRREELAARYGVNGWTVTKALNGLPPYDLPEHGPARPRYERARDVRFEAEQAGVPAMLNNANKPKQGAAVTAPWQVVRSGGRWARG